MAVIYFLLASYQGYTPSKEMFVDVGAVIKMAVHAIKATEKLNIKDLYQRAKEFKTQTLKKRTD